MSKIKSSAKTLEPASIVGGKLKWWDYLIFVVVALICFLCFQQRDLQHTAGCSVGYLNGHIFSFYDYCGEYDIHPSYMPTIYILFAVWNIPMRLAGFLTIPTEDITLAATMWAKILPCAVYLLSGILIYKICMQIGMGTLKSKYCVYACLTMPVAVYNQFIFGQYDIFMTACALLGVYYYLQKKDFWFIFWFAIAVTFKYTALVIFLPLLLLREKKVWRILGSCVLLVLPLALEFFLYRNSPGFSSYAFGVGSSGDTPTGYIFSAGIYTGFQLSAQQYQVSLVVLVYGVILALAYFTSVKEEREITKWAFYLICLSFFVLFGLSKWHPQWLLFAVPFWVISSFMHKDTKIFMILDLLFMIFFVMFIVQTIPNNVDQAMLNKGILKGLVDGDIGTELMMKDVVGKISPELCLSILSMMMLVYALFKHPKYCLADVSARIDCMGWMRTRFLVGVGFFVLPAFLCLVTALTGAEPGYRVTQKAETAAIVNFTERGANVSQRFCSEGNSLEQLQFTVMANGRINDGVLKMTLKDAADGRILYEIDWDTDGFVDGDIISVDFKGYPTEKGHYYEVLFESTAAYGDYCLGLQANNGVSTEDSEEYAMVSGQKQEYQLVMTVYQE